MKKRPPINPDTAALVFRRHFGTAPKKISKVQGGLNNHVFEAQLGTDEFILRISCRSDHLQKFMKEQWAVNTARRNKVPTPEILEVSNDIIELPYMISRKVRGRAAHTLEADRAAVLEQLGHYAAAINSIKTHDFGHIFDWSPNRLSRNPTWIDYLDHEMAIDERIETLRRGRVLNRSSLKKLQQEVQRIRKWKARPYLSHGDIRLKNVMLDPQHKIIAILDWENCTSNVAPYWELSIALHDLTVDEKEAFLRGYGVSLKDFTRMSPSIKTLNILNYALSVGHALERKDEARLSSLRTRLRGTFDLYSL